MATTKGSSAGKSRPAAKAPAVTKGHCQCRNIEYEFTGEPKWVMHCHCESCRRAVSSAVATYVGVRLEQFSYLKGEPTYYEVLARREALLLHQLRLADGLRRRALAGRGASLPRHAGRSRAMAADRTCARRPSRWRGSRSTTTCRATRRRPARAPSPCARGRGSNGCVERPGGDIRLNRRGAMLALPTGRTRRWSHEVRQASDARAARVPQCGRGQTQPQAARPKRRERHRQCSCRGAIYRERLADKLPFGIAAWWARCRAKARLATDGP